MSFNPNDPCTHDSSCFCHWCTGGREDYLPVPKREEMEVEEDRVSIPDFATPRPDLIPLLQIETLPDGVEVATVSCPDHDAFAALPGGLEVLGRIYGKSGWNSDRNIAYYRSDRVLGETR